MAERIRFELTAHDKTKQAFAGVNRGMAKMRRSAQKLSASFRTIGRNVSLFVTAPIAALTTVTARLADTQIQSERSLASALAISGGAVDQRLAGFKKLASAFQDITVVGDEVTLANAQVAISMGLTDKQAKGAAKNAIALSAAFEINAKSAIRYTAALEQGDTTMLNRYIPTLRKFKTTTERTAEAQRILAGAFNVAVEAAKSGLGPFRQMVNELSDLGEEFGTIILPAVTAFSEKMREVIKTISALSPVQKQWILGLTTAFAVGGPIIVGAGLLVAAIGVLLTPLGLVAGAVVTLGVAFGVLAFKASGVKTETQKLRDVLDGMGAPTAVAITNNDLLSRTYGALAEQAKIALKALRATKIFQDRMAFGKAIDAVASNSKSILGFNPDQAILALERAKTKVVDVEASFIRLKGLNVLAEMTRQSGLAVPQIARVASAFKAVQEAVTLAGQATAMQGLIDAIVRARGGVDKLSDSERSFVEQVSRAVLMAGKLSVEVTNAAKPITAAATAAGTLTTALRGATGQAAALSSFLSGLPGSLSGSAAKIAGLKASIAALAGGGNEAAASIAEYRAQLVASLPALASMADGQREFVRRSIEQKVAAHAKEMRLGAEKAKMLENLAKSMADVAGGAGAALESLSDTAITTANAIAGSVAQTVGAGFTSMIDGTKTVAGAFKAMAKNIIAQLFQVLVVQRLVGTVGTATAAGTGLAGFLGGLFGSAKGNAFQGGNVIPFARGGIVTGPTTFPMNQGTGLMGEAGPEAIMPLARGKGGRLGVQASGSQQVVVRVFVDDDGKLGAIARQEGANAAQPIAVKVVQAGLDHFNRNVLPGRVNAIAGDPRVRGR